MARKGNMELTRRDALAALAAAGVAAESALAGCSADDTGPAESSDALADGPIEEPHLATLTAAAEVLYPSAVDGVDEFVASFARGRVAQQPDHAAGVADAAGFVDGWTRSWMDEPFAALDPGDRESALDRLGAREADPDPEGTDAQRVRYYVVNELLFALYSSPTGGTLVGTENPRGHPGGTESYRRGPQ